MFYPVLAQVEPWIDVGNEHRQTNSATVTAGASVEILFCTETIEQSISGVELQSYVRAKVFDERGIGFLSTVRVVYSSPYKLAKFEARVIQPDGSVFVLPHADAISTTVERYQQSITRSEAFANTNIKAGSILDYRYTLSGGGAIKDWRLMLQREFPAREITYRFKGDRQAAGFKNIRMGICG